MSESITNQIKTAEISHRSYDQYIKIFHLGESDILGKRIADLAGGLSDFSETVNSRFRHTGSFSVSLDPSYLFVHTSNTRVELSKQLGYKTVTSYQGGKEVTDEQEADEIVLKRLEEMRESSSTLVAGLAEKAPFRDGSFDLILSSNFLLYPLSIASEGEGKRQGRIAFQEALRTLKDNGELRIWPPGNLLTEIWATRGEGNIALIAETPVLDSEEELVYKLNLKEFEAYREFAKNGARFYLATPKYSDEETSILIVRKDDKDPVINSEHKFIIQELLFNEYNRDDNSPTIPTRTI